MKKTLTISLLSFLIIFSFGASLAYAQPDIGQNNPGDVGQNNPSDNTLPNPFRCSGGECTLFGLLKAIVNNIIMPLAVVLAVLAFIYAGFMYVVAQGNQTKIKEAHNRLLYTAIGVAVLLGAWTIANVIQNTVSSIIN